MPNTFSESDLLLEFPDHWWVKRYDTHQYFSGLSGKGLSGVDFIVLRPEGLLLIEVKNYQARRVEDQSTASRPLQDQPLVLAERIFHKVEDSLRVIRVVHQYYQRRWMYRLFYPLMARWPGYRGEWRFWTEAAIAAQRNDQPAFWLLLEPGKAEARQQLVFRDACTRLLSPMVDEFKLMSSKEFRALLHMPDQQ